MSTRVYTQVARAESTERTRRAILDAGIALFQAGDYDVALDRVAEAAGVTTRTVLRHFGSKEGLVEAAIADQSARIEDERAAPAGDAPARCEPFPGPSFISARVFHAPQSLHWPCHFA